MIFNEIYGTYFRIAAAILRRESTDEAGINDIITKYGFRDSVLFLPQKLIPQSDGSDWGLLIKDKDGRLRSVLKNKPVRLLTLLQKRWLKAILSDPKARLFLTDEEAEKLGERLKDIKPLFDERHFYCTDRFADGDDYADEKYRQNFRLILKAIHEKRVLDIDYTSGHGKRIRRPFVPLKTEYSPKNDKFRLYCLMLRGGGRVSYAIINLGRITQINETPMIWDKPVNAEEPQAKECAEIRITPERNAVERFMMEFASYRKHTERDLETGICTVKLWYDNRDETELLIRLLGFGPVLEILGSENLRKQAAERVFKQKALLTPND